MRRSYSSLLHGQGSGTTWSGRPAARACASRTSRRTPCIATRSNDLVGRGQQAAARRPGIGSSQHVQHPRRVLAARPRDQDLHRAASGWSAPASRSTASATRGPGTTRPSPARTWTRPSFTAGTAASRPQIAIAVGGVGGGPGLVFVQLEDHVRARASGPARSWPAPTRAATSAKTLTPPAAGQHVVQEAAPAAGVDVPQRARSRGRRPAARAAPGRAAVPLAHRVDAPLEAARPPRRRVRRGRCARRARGSS